MASLRERWLGRAALAAALLLLLPVAAQAAMTSRDLNAAFDDLDALGGFFGAFAARETNGFAQERWQRLSRGYPGTAEILRGLLARERLLLADLPPGRVSGVLDRGIIAIDRDLDGRWDGGLTPEARRHDLLLPALIEALARRQAPQDWPWLADHLRAVGGFGALAQDPVARPLLARFFLAKDSYLRLAMQRIGAGDPAARRALAGRQAAMFPAVRDLAGAMAATFGPEPAARLEQDWADYVAAVDGFAVTRGWLLLDPVLRQTRLGAAARRDADAVRQAAAEVVAGAPRSALAAARAGAAGAAAAPRPDAAPQAPGVSLGSLVGQVTPPGPAAEPPSEPPSDAQAPMQAEVATLQSKLDDMAAAVEARAAEAERLATALAAERAAREAAERQAEVARQQAAAEAARQQAAAEAARQKAEAEAARRQAEAEAARRQAEVAEAAAPAAPAAPQLVVVPPPVAVAEPSLPPRADRRQVDAVAAIAVAVLLIVLLVVLLRRGRGQPPAERVPLLLSAPVADDVAAPVAGVTEAAVAVEAPAEPAGALPRAAALPGRPVRVNGVTPPTAAARAAMKAGMALRGAAEAAKAPPVGEADTAAHPIVQALRRGNLPLFELLFRELTDLRAPQLQRIVYGGRGEDLAIVCRAVGVDKLLFGSIFMLTDHLRGGQPEEEPERTAEILRVYDRMPPATARKVLAKWQSDWGGAGRGEPSADG